MADQICIYNPWTNERDPIGGHMRDWKKAEEKVIELSKQNPEWLVIVESGGGYDKNTHGYKGGVRLSNPRYTSGATELSTEWNVQREAAKAGETFGLPRYFVERPMPGVQWMPCHYGYGSDSAPRPRCFVTEFAARQYIRKETGGKYASYRHMRLVLDGKPVLYAISGEIQDGDPVDIGARIEASLKADAERKAAHEAKVNAALVQKEDTETMRFNFGEDGPRVMTYRQSICIHDCYDYKFQGKSDPEILATLAGTADELRKMLAWLEELALDREGHGALAATLYEAGKAASALVKALKDEPQADAAFDADAAELHAADPGKPADTVSIDDLEAEL